MIYHLNDKLKFNLNFYYISVVSTFSKNSFMQTTCRIVISNANDPIDIPYIDKALFHKRHALMNIVLIKGEGPQMKYSPSRNSSAF